MLNLGETSEPSPLPLLEDTSGNTGTPGEIADKTVDKDCVYEVLLVVVLQNQVMKISLVVSLYPLMTLLVPHCPLTTLSSTTFIKV